MEERKIFNAAEALKNFDPSIDKIYCGPGKEYPIGCEFRKLEPIHKTQFEKASNFRIGDLVTTEIEIGEADPETKGTKTRPIGEATIIDIIKSGETGWRLRLRYLISNNYKGNLWMHYSDVRMEKCSKINE